jgi:hypothetical protein
MSNFMPYSEQHKNKRTKNYMLLAVLIGIFGVLYYVTLVKFGSLTGK